MQFLVSIKEQDFGYKNIILSRFLHLTQNAIINISRFGQFPILFSIDLVNNKFYLGCSCRTLTLVEQQHNYSYNIQEKMNA